MSSTFSALGGLASRPGSALRPQRVADWIARALARNAVRLQELGTQWFATAAENGVRDRQSPSRCPASSPRRPGDVLAGQPAVVIPLNRAVVCGEDHVYDVGQFNVCPNCAAEERLPLIELLAHERKTLVAITR